MSEPAFTAIFKDVFGENRTPQDIKWALNNTEEALGVVVTQWENPPDAYF